MFRSVHVPWPESSWGKQTDLLLVTTEFELYCGITLYRLIINPADIVDRSHIFLVLRILWKYIIGFWVKDDKVQNLIHDIKKANFQVLAV